MGDRMDGMDRKAIANAMRASGVVRRVAMKGGVVRFVATLPKPQSDIKAIAVQMVGAFEPYWEDHMLCWLALDCQRFGFDVLADRSIA